MASSLHSEIWWNLALHELPQHSRLNHQNPVGIGTPYVESLSSYIRRIARSHCLYPGTIIYDEIAPLSCRKSQQLNSVFNTLGRAVNGLGATAKDFVQALETLTLRKDLHLLTLIPLAEVFHARKLSRLNQAWCPMCYEHWQSTNQEIYDPLLWTIEAVSICPIHYHPLVDTCPHCKQSFYPLDGFSNPGYCPNCGQWLGTISSYKEQELKAEEVEKQVWFATSLGDVFAILSDLQGMISKDKVVAKLAEYINKTADGNIVKFSRLLGFSPGTATHWLTKRHFPSLISLLEISFYFKSSLTNILTGLCEESNLVTGGIVPDQAKTTVIGTKGRSQFSTEQLEELQAYLQQVLESGDSALPLKEVAKHLGTTSNTLHKYFPTLCDAITKRNFATDVTSLSKERIEQFRIALENTLASDADLPALYQLASCLNTTPRTLWKYFPELCNTYIAEREKRKSYVGTTLPLAKRLAEVQSLLEAALAGINTPSAVFVIARDLHVNTPALRKAFPDLCEAITARRELEQQNVKIEKLDFIREGLEGICNSDDCPPTIASIARQYRISGLDFQRKFPDLYQTIKIQRAEFKELQAAERLQKLESGLKTYLEGEKCPPPLAEITKSLQTDESTVRNYFPELLDAILQRRYEHKQGLNQPSLIELEDILKQILNDESDSPSMREVGRRLGYYTQTLNSYFPDLCKEISEKFLDFQHTASQKRIQDACEEVKQAVAALVGEKVYPSGDRVRNRMSKPGYFRYKEVHISWKNALQSFGFRT
ncbi:TniQ family protein [Leptolyngbya sp. AN02str]|uniref:TniQ family protein n=1 Tax=Leptolyngbya sp. AN02str TaxID=3423363 RepID=UPI003D31B280